MISPKVIIELHQAKLVPTQFTVPTPAEHAWSTTEQRRFWEAIDRFPQGPWTAIAAYIGTKSTRQAMTHAQKLRQKLTRWKRRARSESITSQPEATSLNNNGVYNQYPPPLSTHPSHPLQLPCVQDPLKTEDTKASKEELDDEMKEQDIKPVVTPEYDQQSHHQNATATAIAGGHDAYLDHLLSDIDPMLETVANFTSVPPPYLGCHQYQHHHHQFQYPSHQYNHHQWQYNVPSSVCYVDPVSIFSDSLTKPEPIVMTLSSSSTTQPQLPQCISPYSDHVRHDSDGDPFVR